MTDRAALVLLVVAAPPATAFPLVYWFSGMPWRGSLIGRALMTMSVGLAGLIDVSLTYRAFGIDPSVRDPLRVAVFSIVALAEWMLLIALIRAWRSGSLEKEEDS